MREHPRVRHPTGDFCGGSQVFVGSSPRRYLRGVSALGHRRRDKLIFILARSPRGDPLCFAVPYRSTTRGEGAVGKSPEKRAAVTSRDFFFFFPQKLSNKFVTATLGTLLPPPVQVKTPREEHRNPKCVLRPGRKGRGQLHTEPLSPSPSASPRLQAPGTINPAKRRISAQSWPVVRPVHP